MSPGPTRRLGNYSRAANGDGSNKSSGLKLPLDRSTCGSQLLFNQVLEEHGPGDTTHRPLTPMDLSLPPFRIVRNEESVMADNISEENLGSFACQPIDEDALCDVEGMPTRVQWKSIVEGYLASLHPSKRHKSLISQEVYKMIFRTLKDPDATRLGTPQFRFWARKMFQLVKAVPSNMLVVTNAGRPVAIKEHIYDILCMCHAECGHGGRDKTCKVLREYYTWVPKELISNFVKECPTCAPRKLAATKSKERKAEAAHPVLEERVGAPRFSVERLKDFGQLPSPASNESHQLKLPPLSVFSRSVPSPFCRDYGPEKCFIPVNFPANKPHTPSSSKSNVVLPPLSTGPGNGSDVAAPNMNRQIPLPPLMQYLSRNFEFEGGSQNTCNADAEATQSDIPIDPSLLAISTQITSSQCDCGEPRCSRCTAPSYEPCRNALHLQLRLPSRERSSGASGQLSLDSSATQSGSPEVDAAPVAWEFPSVASIYGGESDNSALLSASTVSIGLPTPLPSGQISPVGTGRAAALEFYSPETQPNSVFGGFPSQYGFGNCLPVSGIKNERGAIHIQDLSCAPSPPLYSPRPVRVAETNAVLEMAAAATEVLND